MMLCDISVVFNSFADTFGLMSRKLSSKNRRVLVCFQSSESFAASNSFSGRFDRAKSCSTAFSRALASAAPPSLTFPVQSLLSPNQSEK